MKKGSASKGGSLSTPVDDKVKISDPVVNPWASNLKLADKIKVSTPSTVPNTVLTTKPPLSFVDPQSHAQQILVKYIHRINTPITYGAVNEVFIDVAIDDSRCVIPSRSAEYVIGVSYFIPSDDYMSEAHKTFRAYKFNGCFLSGGNLPEGIGFKQDRALIRNDKRRNPQDMGLHFSVFPTQSMPVEEFERKLTEMKVDAQCLIAGRDQCERSEAQPTPDYPADALLRQVSAALFELATNGSVDPNRAFRALYFHYLLAEKDAEYKWILRGDALSYYSAQALELCNTSSNISIEEIRDEIRGALAEVILYNPVYRSYPDDYNEVETTSLILFGECMENPQEDDDNYGDFDDTVSDAGELMLSDTIPPSELIAGETLNVSAGEVSKMIFYIIKYNVAWYFLNEVNKLSPNSGIEAVPTMRESQFSRKSWSPAEVTMMNFCHILPPDAQFRLMVHSLTVQIDNVPRECGAAFVKVLESNSDLSNVFLAVVACLRSRSFASTHFLGARQTDSYRIVEYEGHGKSVCVSIFDTVTRPTMNSAHICTAVNKCIKCFKRDVWRLRRRVIVMCLSQSHSVDLTKVHPGSTDAAVRKRKLLRSNLQSCLGVLPSDEFIFGPCGNVHKFLVFSYGEDLHKLTSAVTSDCFKQLQVSVSRVSHVVVKF